MLAKNNLHMALLITETIHAKGVYQFMHVVHS